MITGDLLRKIRRIEITTNRLVDELMAGQYQSAFKGRGMEFSEVREYMPGDDIRTIDWNVTARFNKPFVKRYVEERELTVLFLIDMSGSQIFGSTHRVKCELAAEICAVLAFSAIKNNDQVGSILFSDQIESYIPPKKGSQHVLRVVRDILFKKPSGKGTDISMALEYLNRVQKKKAVVFLVSDFQDDGFEKPLRIAAKHHDLIAISITDRREFSVPSGGWIGVKDPETNEETYLNLSSESVRSTFEKRRRQEWISMKKLFASVGIDHVNLHTDKPYEVTLYRFLQSRARRMR